MLTKRTREFTLQNIERQANGAFTGLATLESGSYTTRLAKLLEKQMPCKFYLLHGNEAELRPIGKLSLAFVSDDVYQVTGNLFVASETEDLLRGAFLLLQSRRLNEDPIEHVERVCIRARP